MCDFFNSVFLKKYNLQQINAGKFSPIWAETFEPASKIEKFALTSKKRIPIKNKRTAGS